MKIILFLSSLLILSSCAANTQLSGIVDPKYSANFHAEKIIILGTGMSIKEQKKFQIIAQQALDCYNVTALNGLKVFPPTRHFAKKYLFKQAQKYGADTLFLVNVVKRKNPHKSPIFFENISSLSENLFPFMMPTRSSRSRKNYPIIAIRIVLINAKNGETIWVAEGNTIGIPLVDFSDLIEDATKAAITKLEKNGLIAAR